MVQRKPVPYNATLPDSLRVGPPQFDGNSESRRQSGSYQAASPHLSPETVPAYEAMSPARRSAEIGSTSEELRGAWDDRPQHPPEFAHLAATSGNYLSPPTEQFGDLHVRASSTISSDSRGNSAQSYLQPQNSGGNPWGDSSAVDGMLHAPPEPTTLHHVETSDSVSSANDAWAFEAIGLQPPVPERAAPTAPVSHQELPAYRPQSPAWDEEDAEHAHTPAQTPESQHSRSAHTLAGQASPLPEKGGLGANSLEVDNGSATMNPWDDAGSCHKEPITPQTTSNSRPRPPIPIAHAIEEGGWEELDQGLQASPSGNQETGVVSGGQHILDQPINPPPLPSRNIESLAQESEPEGVPPTMPARNIESLAQRREKEGVPPTMPSRNIGSLMQGREREGVPPSMPPRRGPEHSYAPPSGPPPGYSATNDQKYQIKKITWHDHSSPVNPRISPILTQNANGPCPLLALVNAMVLSTPSGSTNEIADYLSSKTEVSLDDLLQAIISEHLSEENCRRRAEKGGEEYPDIGELHEFLKRLHTGMNVNPRFVPPNAARSPASMRNSMSHMHPSERSESGIPGTFEQTKELELYASFGIRLIHGWLPEPSSPAFKAFENQAQTHEDAQLVLLRQDDLEHRLENASTGGLTDQEAALLQDIYLMQQFMQSNPTQLSPFGLEAIRTSLKNGEFAILFRNSHFMVVYKHPESEMLFALVTDEGYRELGEAVWESLMDCDGSSMEIFSGNFEILSGATHASRGGAAGNLGSSATFGNSSPHSSASQRQGLDRIASAGSNASAAAEDRERREREDADMAFALSMQDRLDAEVQAARHRREQELSERFIESSRGEGGEARTIPIERPEGGRAVPAAAPVNTRNANSPRAVAAAPGNTRDANSGIPESLLQVPVRPADPEAGVENPPPSYELAKSLPRYEGPVEMDAEGGGWVGEGASGAGVGSVRSGGRGSGSVRREGSGAGGREARRAPEVRRSLGAPRQGATAGQRVDPGIMERQRKDKEECGVM